MPAYKFKLNKENNAIEDVDEVIVTGRNQAQARAALVAGLYGDPETMTTDALVEAVGDGARIMRVPKNEPEPADTGE